VNGYGCPLSKLVIGIPHDAKTSVFAILAKYSGQSSATARFAWATLHSGGVADPVQTALSFLGVDCVLLEFQLQPARRNRLKAALQPDGLRLETEEPFQNMQLSDSMFSRLPPAIQECSIFQSIAARPPQKAYRAPPLTVL
jgi:hypothetical protein